MSDREIFMNRPANASPEEMSAYLDEACHGDEALRARVEALLAADEEAETAFLGLQPAALLPESSQARPSSLGANGGQEVIGRFRLLQKIGAGGMGEVWLAEQREPVRRKVALKVIKLGMDTQEVLVRFEAERQALALMNHPNIASVFDGGSTVNGRPFFAMELVQGLPITEYCDKARLGTRERLGLFIQVCDAVQHAHQKGVIHRDIKPTNVMVSTHEGKPHVKVIDFGVAKAVNQRLTERTLFTRYGQMVGTPSYMSPEQAEFTTEDVDTRSDIYSLGCLLYELLTSSPPFEPTRLREMAFDEMCRMIREDEPPKPSTRLGTLGAEKLSTVAARRHTDARQLSKTVRGELDWIAMQALEKDRERRYHSARDLALDVQRYLADEPVSAAASSAAYRIHKFVRRHLAQVTPGLIAALACIASLVLADSPGFKSAELRSADVLTDGRAGGRLDEELMLIAVDDASLDLADTLGEAEMAAAPELREMARGWPFPRGVHAALAEKVLDAGAKLIVFDVIFDGEKSGDEALKRVLETHPRRVVTGSARAPGSLRDSMPSRSVVDVTDPYDSRVGSLQFRPDEDGTIRRLDLDDSITRAALLQLGLTPPPIDADGTSLHLRFPSQLGEIVPPPLRPLPYYSLFLPSTWNNDLRKGEIFRDKIVFVGSTSSGMHDTVRCPSGTLFGVQMHMIALSAAMNGSHYEVPSTTALIGAVILAAITGMLVATRLRAPTALVTMAGVAAVYLLAVRWCYFSRDLLLPSFAPAATFVITGVLCLVGASIERRGARHAKPHAN